MLDYTNKWMSEIIKSVKASNGKTDFDITTVLDVEKTAGNISEKEIWPGEASRIRIYTNYDYEKQTMRLPNSAYDGPILSLKKLNNTPFEITVKPYPVMSKWRFEYSPNLVNIQAFNAIYAGEKTVTLPLDLLYRPEPEEGEENEEVSPEYCWIRVVPAIS